MKKTIVVLTGSGISAESGISTFRDSGGLWEGYDVMEVASIDGWNKNPAKVVQFYNERRRKAMEAKPNAAHLSLAQLEKNYNVVIITQNVDDLHERGGSSHIIHLHGELKKARSTGDENLIYELKDPFLINIGDKCEKGFQLRPDIVWFGEPVPKIQEAAEWCMKAEILLVIGTSLVVYPAAGLLNYAPLYSEKYLIDPNPAQTGNIKKLTVIKEKATTGVPKVVAKLSP